MLQSQLHQCQSTVAILVSGTQTDIYMVQLHLGKNMHAGTVPIHVGSSPTFTGAGDAWLLWEKEIITGKKQQDLNLL